MHAVRHLTLAALHAALLAGCAASRPAPGAPAGAPARTAPLAAPPAAAAAPPAPAATAPAPAPPARHAAPAGPATLVEVARSPALWNVVAVSPRGRVFASLPRWLSDRSPSVVEVLPDGALRPFPGGAWHDWTPGAPAADALVSVNGVFADRANHLWIADTGAPAFGPAVDGGPKVVEVDLATDRVVRVYRLDRATAPARSYLNDVRVDDTSIYATDSGTGALIVIDRKTGAARRLLASHPATKASPGVVPRPEGQELRDAAGEVVRIHADQLELDPTGTWLYFQPLSGPLFRVETRHLRDVTLSEDELAGHVERFHDTPPIGGLCGDGRGNLYLGVLGDSSIVRLGPDRATALVARDARLAWPDGCAVGPDGFLYVPAAQAHRMPMFQGGTSRLETPFRLFKVRIHD
jgi:sugar lactone lactonase YvrE